MRALVRQLRDRLFFFRRYPFEEIRVAIDEHTFRFTTESSFSRHWFYPRYMDDRLHEPVITRHMIERMRNASVFLDVGSCVGYYSVLASRYIPDGSVHAFEIDPFLVDEIRTNLRLNGAEEVRVHNVAVGRESGHLYAVSNRSGSPLRHVLPQPPRKLVFHSPEVRRVEVVSLDETIDKPVDLVKIDVEGAEYEVLKGMTRILADNRPCLYVEVHPGGVERFGASMNDILDLLTSHSYRVVEIEDFKDRRDSIGFEPVSDLSHLERATMLYGEPV